MVEFEEIKDEHFEPEGFEDASDASDDEYSSASEADDKELDDDDDTNLQDETLLDRIKALKDIIPAQKRNSIYKSFSKAYEYGSMATFIGGKAAYIIVTSCLLVFIPFALSLE